MLMNWENRRSILSYSHKLKHYSTRNSKIQSLIKNMRINVSKSIKLFLFLMNQQNHLHLLINNISVFIHQMKTLQSFYLHSLLRMKSRIKKVFNQTILPQQISRWRFCLFFQRQRRVSLRFSSLAILSLDCMYREFLLFVFFWIY